MHSANLTRSHADLVEAAVRESIAAAMSGVVASWRRSMVYHGLDPSLRGPAKRVAETDLRQARDKYGALLDIAGPSLEHLFRIAGQAGCCVVLTDDTGLILDSRSNAGDRQSFEGWGLTEGAVWSESAEGTNGIGTCLAEKRPVIIHKDQHFRADNTAMSCMGAPIHDPQGQLIAVLDVSSCRNDMSTSFAQVLGAVVNDSARTMENDLFRAAFPKARILVADGNNGRNGLSLLAVDEDDLVIGATRQARKLHGLTSERIEQTLPLSDVLGDRAGRSPESGAQKAELRRALSRCRGNISAAARFLGISRATMYRRMQRCGLASD
ncbi:GAF domain-containing protein [uncultured Roseibium sp.]|uniref:GAF domain-containing protein n=1 Tax=uncultured Roseibium sp. TaxID=1936171 RepID=UPI003217A5CC